MKIYTRNGDKGETGLLGAIQVSKSHLAIEVCGSLDETNCHVGCAVCTLSLATQQSETNPTKPDLIGTLTRIQNELFDLGSRVAAALSDAPKTQPATSDGTEVDQLEAWIDYFDSKIPPLKMFILPGGSPVGSQMHLARSVCRRAERSLVALIKSGVKRDLSSDLIYLNRLSDLFFVLARYTNQLEGVEETPWSAT